jgi:putative transposase
VICPKYRYRKFKGEIAEYSKHDIYSLVKQKDLVEIFELSIQPDHIHTVMSIALKYSVSSLMGFLKGKIAINLFKKYERIGKRFWGRHLWSQGYCASTIGLNEEQIGKYVEFQERKDKEAEHLGLDLE